VKGAKTEFEVIERLARWSAGRWGRGHLKDAYPPWDALEILKPHADGKPTGGFCQQYNVVFLQACESYGIPGRAVSIGVGDHVITIGGIHGTVQTVDEDTTHLEVAPGMTLTLARTAIARRVVDVEESDDSVEETAVPDQTDTP
jgi:transglutaminase-like putative cysteine protease